MSERNKSYRIRVTPGENTNISLKLDQDYDTFEILSLKLDTNGSYRLHDSDYGVVVGRVQSGNFGIPNAKVSIFIEADTTDDIDVRQLYPYQNSREKGPEGIRYNLLPDQKVDNCHQVVGTFPNKRYLLDNDVLLEIFDKYYKYTTRTNNSGDYIICGVPVGSQTIHMDLDLSDCGILSQRPRDFAYKGYTIEQFENPSMFKVDKELDTLSQIFSQDLVVNVIPFWGNESEGSTVGITRGDINIPFKFEPTCVFMGCIVGDNASNGISKKCIPTENMGAMDELVTGKGTIEMIRKTPTGGVEEFQVKGTELIDSNGVWCYQIPMNLDYMMTDEYGNMVPTNDPEKGIPTRTRVRFRISMEDLEENSDNFFRAKVLVPHNPSNNSEVDYNFGSNTQDNSFRDLFWNCVYSVKSYIPRFQKSQHYKNEKFTGIKHCNIRGQNNPIPYNNIRIKLPLMFTILCVLIKTYIKMLGYINGFLFYLADFLTDLAVNAGWVIGGKGLLNKVHNWRYSVVTEGLCPDLESWYFAPIIVNNQNYWRATVGWTGTDLKYNGKYYDVDLLGQTFKLLSGNDNNSTTDEDKSSIDYQNRPSSEESICLTVDTTYLVSCIEMNLAQEYKVINFDFYNDWINGLIYIPRWMRFVRKKRNYLFGIIKVKERIRGCMNVDSEGRAETFGRVRKYTQQCYLSYTLNSGDTPTIKTSTGCNENDSSKMQCHKKNGMRQINIFGSHGGVVQEKETMYGQYVYYFKPKEIQSGGNMINLFSTDIILLGSLNEIDTDGIPQAFKHIPSSTYQLPTNLALTNMDTNGILYGRNGTMCSGQNKDVNIQKIDGYDQTFQREGKFYNGTNNEMTFGSLDDYIPLTEAAGISWNYTGPGQGYPDPISGSTMYHPGGHFLGLSCVNSATNIKSCINLERICEIGTSMSVRHEEVMGISASGDRYVVKYRNYVPTGIINKMDISDPDFRSMFATMNHKRLIAVGKDAKTGYPMYEFSYVYGNGFDGVLSNHLGSKYNRAMSSYTTDESSYIGANSEQADYDSSVKAQTYTRTLEERNVDYYMFRMGLDTMDVSEQTKKYGYTAYDGSQYSYGMPQYENSFYFYFGLKDGSTALDEFNKQFFSPCGESELDAEES